MTKEKRLVWDLPLRLLHWLLAISLAGSWYTAENGSEFLNIGDTPLAYIQIHFYLGYFALGMVTFRIIWGFVGPRHARFSTFLAGGSKFASYARGLFKRDSAPAVGHNPVGGWMVVLMLLMVGAQAVTGLFLIDNTEIWPAPYHPAVSGETAASLGKFHRINFNVLLWVVSLHVLAILFYVFYKRQNLVGPMLAGHKPGHIVPAHEAIASSQLLKALIIALLCAGAVYLLLSQAPPPPVDDYSY
jgi:cytochrome b